MKTLMVMLSVACLPACAGEVEPARGIAACESWNEAHPEARVGTARAYLWRPQSELSGWEPVDGSPPVSVEQGANACDIVQSPSGAWDLSCCASSAPVTR